MSILSLGGSYEPSIPDRSGIGALWETSHKLRAKSSSAQMHRPFLEDQLT